MLRLLNINTFYGEIHVLKNISLHIAEGEIVSLIGANGAGKTTLLNTISGIINARTGQIMYNNKDIARKSPDRVVKMGISQVPEGRQIFNPLTVLDNLKLGSYIRYRRDGSRKIQRDNRKKCLPCSPFCRSGRISLPAPSPAVSSRCLLSGGRS